FITRNIRKYFGAKTSKETQEDLPVSSDESHDEKGLDNPVEEVELEEASKDDVEEEGVEAEKTKEKKEEPKNKMYDNSFSQVAGSAEYQEAFEKYLKKRGKKGRSEILLAQKGQKIPLQ
ncbi:MAG: hypothetical protein PWP06_657, partial [Candidatus Marinimicrobia bacterium]|nr:hypothetical protein [Candidatus Neomarinimicrobiota bacterium]